jgi:hypothetical protein
MTRTALFVLCLVTGGFSAAEAQSRIYLAATTAVDAGERGNIPGGAVPSIGGVIGLSLTEAWSVEVEIERGFMTTHNGTGEAVLVSFPPSRNPTREEIELYGIRTRNERTQRTGGGWAAHAVWRSRAPGRVNGGLMAGVAARGYDAELVRTTTFVSPLIDLPPGYQLPDEHSTRRMVGYGLSGGIVIPVRITTHLALEPELRVTVLGAGGFRWKRAVGSFPVAFHYHQHLSSPAPPLPSSPAPQPQLSPPPE